MNDGEVDGDSENLASTAREVQEEWCNSPVRRVVGSEDGQGEADADATDTCGSPQNGMHTLAYAVAVGILYDREGVVGLKGQNMNSCWRSKGFVQPERGSLLRDGNWGNCCLEIGNRVFVS